MSNVIEELKEEADNIYRNLDSAIRCNETDKVKEIIEIIKSPELQKYPKIFNLNNPIGSHFIGNDYAITIAAEHSNNEILKLLINNGADLNLTNHWDKNAFAIIVERREFGTKEEEKEFRTQKVAIIKTILEAGYNIETKDKFGYTALHHVLFDKDNRLFDAIMEHNPNVNSLNNRGESCLLSAVHSHNIYRVKKLIEAGAKPDKSKKALRSELTCATINNDLEMCEALIKAGAKVNPTIRYEDSPLYFSRNGTKNKNIETLLLQNGARKESRFEATVKSISNKFQEAANKRYNIKQQKIEAKMQKNEALQKLRGIKPLH